MLICLPFLEKSKVSKLNCTVRSFSTLEVFHTSNSIARLKVVDIAMFLLFKSRQTITKNLKMKYVKHSVKYFHICTISYHNSPLKGFMW